MLELLPDHGTTCGAPPRLNPRKPKRNETARAAGTRMLGNVNVKAYIDEISEVNSRRTREEHSEYFPNIKSEEVKRYDK